MKRRLLGGMFWGLLLVAAAGASSVASPSAGLESADTRTEHELLQLINHDRAERGLPQLAPDPGLDRAAHQHLEWIVRARKLSHQFPGEAGMGDRIASTGLRYDRAGENVAQSNENGSPRSDAEEAHSILMHSPPHRENLLNPDFNMAGVAVASAGGQVWVVEDFARGYQSASAAEVERRALRAFQKARTRDRLPPVGVASLPHLRDYACRDDVTTEMLFRQYNSAPSAVPGMRVEGSSTLSATVYTTFTLDELPDGLLQIAANPRLHYAAFAACALNSSAAHGSFRVVSVFLERWGGS